MTAEEKLAEQNQQNYFKNLHKNHRLNAYFLTLRNRFLAVLDSEAIKQDQKPEWLVDLNTTC